MIVQRVLAAKNISHAKAGVLLAGFLKVLPLFTMVFPGMIMRIARPDILGCPTPDICQEMCGSTAGCSGHTLSLLVFTLLKKGRTIRYVTTGIYLLLGVY